MMNSSPVHWKHLRYLLILFAPLWIATTVLFASIAFLGSVISTDYWTATQPLVLRDEATGAALRQGRFPSQTELKAAQETALEMARNHEVVAAALRTIGPPKGSRDPIWPSANLIAGTAKKRVNLKAPQGGEFGGSEVCYLQVEQNSPERARAFCEALFDALSTQMRDVRRIRADSLIAELTHARDLARKNLEDASVRMREIEVNVGSDLGELRNLSEAITGDGVNRRSLEETQRELQQAELQLEKLESLHRLLVQGFEDPTRLLVSGGELLAQQPSLQRLKDGLIDAQLEQSHLAGRLTRHHPRVLEAIETEQEIRSAIQAEISSVIRTMAPVLEVERDRVARLRDKQDNLQRRLDRLAGVRTHYSKISSEVKHATTLVEQAQRALTDAQASRSAALSTNLIAKLGPVTTGDRPNGISTSLTTVGGAAAGLIFGLGTVFLVAPGPNQTRFGRRWSDVIGGRRATDQPCQSTSGGAPPTSTALDRRRSRTPTETA